MPKGLTAAAIDLMFDGDFEFSDATRAARPEDMVSTPRTEVRYSRIDTDDDTIELRASK